MRRTRARSMIAATQARFGVSYHVNCHSMNSVAGVHGEGGKGAVRADFVLGHRDGSACEPGFTDFVREVLAGMGYQVKVNDPYKGVELVRAYSEPAAGATAFSSKSTSAFAWTKRRHG